MNTSTHTTHNSQQGFVLVTAMVFLLALTLLGILAVNNSSFERLIGSNERLQADTFYQADSGIGAAVGLLGMNIALKGFSANEAQAMRGMGFDPNYNNQPVFYMKPDATLQTFRGTPVDLNGDGNVDANDEGIFFGQNALALAPNPTPTFYRDAYYPRVTTGAIPGQPPTTSIKIDAQDAGLVAGSAIQSNEGYDIKGPGSGSGSGGAEKIYDIRSRHDNINSAVSQMHIQWRHVIK